MKIIYGNENAGQFVCKSESTVCGDFTKYTVMLTSKKKTALAAGALRFGFLNATADTETGFIMTHDAPVKRYRLPFAFPAVISEYGDGTYVLAVFDYYKTSEALRNAVRDRGKDGWFCGIENTECSLAAGETVQTVMYLSEGVKCGTLMTSLIGKCAHIVLEECGYAEKAFESDYTYRVKNYEEASRGLTNNLEDRRAIIQDGIGTFNPYGYHEIGAYTESFAAMDVAKGLYRYALLSEDRRALSFIKRELYKLVDPSLPHPWIDKAHNTEGFFHLAWGAIPQDSGVAADFARDTLFSDFDGHEEGPNLLSTFKYFDRVELLGEMALLEGDEKLKEGFARTLPFIGKLKMPDYSQPVTYDLDSHEPKTGKDSGGSAGGAAIWACIQFVAYELFQDSFYREEGLKAVAACDRLDYPRMFSMRCAPKPIALGWTVRANILAYRHTGEKKYLSHALKIADGIFAHYYISPHPYAFFPVLGFGYACARERWEAFREMVETLWLASPILSYTENKDLFRLYALAKQNVLWALPVNGNPCGNLEREYESIGGEYIPFEFSTGHIGDNPGLEGGCQASQRQIKEIYGSGEVFLAYCLFEAGLQSFNKNIMAVNPHAQFKIGGDTRDYILYNAAETEQKGIVRFHGLPRGSYKLVCGDEVRSASHWQLENGQTFTVQPRAIVRLHIEKESENCVQPCVQSMDSVPCARGFEALDLSWKEQTGAEFYTVTVQNDLNEKTYPVVGARLRLEINAEIDNRIKVCGYGGESVWEYRVLDLPARRKVFSYWRDFSDTSDLKLENLAAVADGHMYMLYSQDAANRSAVLEIPAGKKRDGYDLLQFAVSSCNNGPEWRCLVAEGKELAGYNSSAGLFETDIADIPEGQEIVLRFELRSKAGLGLSVGRIMEFRVEPCRQPVFKPVTVSTDAGSKASVEIPSGYKFVDIAATVEDIREELYFALNGKELQSEPELEFPIKKNRGATGVYRFPIEGKGGILEMFTNQKERDFIQAVVLTSDNGCPVYTDYFKQEGKSDEI